MTSHQLPLRDYDGGMIEPEAPAISVQTIPIDNLDNLASSRPIPLCALSGRAFSRNKGSKAWKPLQLSDLDYDDTKDHASLSTRFSEASQYDHRSHLSAIHQFRNDENSLRCPQMDPTALSSRHSQERSLVEADEHEWVEDLKVGVHRNPLSYSSSYDFTSHDSLPQQQEYNSGSLFLRNENCLYVEYPTYFTNGAPKSPGRSSPSGMQSPYGQTMAKPYYMYPISSYMSQYEVPSHESRQHSQMVPTAPALTRQYSLQEPMHERYEYYGRMKTNGICSSIRGQLLSMLEGIVPTDKAAQMHVPNTTLTRAPNAGRRSKAIEIKRPTSTPYEGPKHSKRSTPTNEELREKLKQAVKEKIEEEKKREAEELKAMADEMKVKELSLPDGLSEAESHTEKEHQEQRQKANDDCSSQEVTQAAIEEPFRESEKELPTSRETGATDEKSRLLSKAAAEHATNEQKTELATPRKAANEKLRLLCDSSVPEPWKQKSYFQGKIPETRKVLSEESGQPSRLINQRRLPSFGSHRGPVDTIIEGINEWFYTDNRRDEPTRLCVSKIAQAHAEHLSKLNGASYPVEEIETLKQTTDLLGNVILNLHSYVSGNREDQAANFANFGTVPAHCYDGHDDYRSYFECDTWID